MDEEVPAKLIGQIQSNPVKSNQIQSSACKSDDFLLF
jgi:hypothetical protein